jgi:phospholipid transport system substrate-binding protein
MKPLRLSLCAALLAAFCGATASALFSADKFSSREAAQQDVSMDPSTPEALVRRVALGMLEAAASAAASEPRSEILVFAEERVLPHVDFAEAARLAAGDAWTRANALQRAQLAAAFRPMLIRGYLEALRGHKGQTLAVLPVRGEARRSDDITVQSRLEGAGGAPLAVEYALRRRGGEWKIYDIRIDGESLAASCRPVFERVARAEGIGGLIKRIQGNTRGRPTITA